MRGGGSYQSEETKHQQIDNLTLIELYNKKRRIEFHIQKLMISQERCEYSGSDIDGLVNDLEYVELRIRAYKSSLEIDN